MKKWISMLLLLAVIFISLALSTLPIFSNIPCSVSEGFVEGFISPKNITSVQTLLDTYNTNIENHSKSAVTGEGTTTGGLKNIKWSQANLPTAKEIFSQPGITYTNMVQQVMEKITPIDPASKIILSNTSGQLYSETQTLLNDIVALKIKDDDVFMSIINKNVATPIIISKGTSVSSAQQIHNYLNGAPAL